MANKTDENRNYAKEAKKRMKGGFWDSKLTEWDNLRSAAEKEGRSTHSNFIRTVFLITKVQGLILIMLLKSLIITVTMPLF